MFDPTKGEDPHGDHAFEATDGTRSHRKILCGDRHQMTELSREEALAAALGEYRREADRHGPYRGFLAEAYELIRRLEERGYTITPLK